MGAIKDYFNRKWEEKNKDPNRSTGMSESIQKTEDAYKEGGKNEGFGKGTTSIVNPVTKKEKVVNEPETKTKQKQVTAKDKDGNVLTFNDYEDFISKYQSSPVLADSAWDATLAYANGNVENAKNLYKRLGGGTYSEAQQKVIDRVDNPGSVGRKEKAQTAFNEAEKAADEVGSGGIKAWLKTQSPEYQEAYNKVYENLQNQKGKIDDSYIENLPHFIWDEYKYLEKGYKDRGASDEEAKKAAKKQLGYYLVDNLGTALTNMSHIIKGDGGQEKSDWEKVKESRLQGAMERYNEKRKEEMQMDIDLVKKYIGNDAEAINNVKQIYMNAKLRNLFGKLDNKYKVYLIREMLASGVKLDVGEIGELTMQHLARQAADGTLTEKLEGGISSAAGGLMDLATKTK